MDWAIELRMLVNALEHSTLRAKNNELRKGSPLLRRRKLEELDNACQLLRRDIEGFLPKNLSDSFENSPYFTDFISVASDINKELREILFDNALSQHNHEIMGIVGRWPRTPNVRRLLSDD